MKELLIIMIFCNFSCLIHFIMLSDSLLQLVAGFIIYWVVCERFKQAFDVVGVSVIFPFEKVVFVFVFSSSFWMNDIYYWYVDRMTGSLGE